ncbi:unnamed protein product [Echinostoma caproni]|uniref:Doublecortin domain-containing protein n=1 Tax=Echinostoma caproni TaxID=27848 RepID=A0A183ATB2_9TREM|nr:unnamed protein product [Echinostoma caproni]
MVGTRKDKRYALQLINPASNIKVTGLKARTDVYRITGLMPDIPVDFHTMIARFSTLTKPIEDSTLVIDRVAHHIVTKGQPVTTRSPRLAPDKLAFAKNPKPLTGPSQPYLERKSHTEQSGEMPS